MEYKKVKWITEEEVKKNSKVSDNLESQAINPIIGMVQDTRMTSLLGSEFYKQLRQNYVDDNVNPVHRMLIREYIFDVLLWGTVAELQVPNFSKIQNVGITSGYSDQSQTVQHKDMMYNVTYYNNKADFYQAEALKFIVEHASDFPLINCKVVYKFPINLTI